MVNDNLEEKKIVLKKILNEMFKIAMTGNVKEIMKINTKTFTPLMIEVFGKANRKMTEEERVYDLARNNILNILIDPLTEKQKKFFIAEAKKYINML